MIDSTCREETSCQSNGKVVTGKLKPCGSNTVCGINNGIRGCVCKKGFQLTKGKCVVKGI